jgi:WD40 repeat protein
VSYSPDGRAIAAGGSDGKIRVWDAAGGQLVGDLSYEHRKGSVCAVNWAMGGLVVGDRDGNVVIWR